MQDYQAGENVRRLYHQRPAPLQGQRLGQWFARQGPECGQSSWDTEPLSEYNRTYAR